MLTLDLGQLERRHQLAIDEYVPPDDPAWIGAEATLVEPLHVRLVAQLAGSDVVAVCCPLTEATRGLVDADFLARMRHGALLVNAARGPVVDTAALLTEVASGRIGAALDVTDPEPLPAGHPLWALPNVLITPHIGGAVAGLLPRAYRLAGEQLRRFAAGEPLANRVVDGY